MSCIKWKLGDRPLRGRWWLAKDSRLHFHQFQPQFHVGQLAKRSLCGRFPAEVIRPDGGKPEECGRCLGVLRRAKKEGITQVIEEVNGE